MLLVDSATTLQPQRPKHDYSRLVLDSVISQKPMPYPDHTNIFETYSYVILSAIALTTGLCFSTFAFLRHFVHQSSSLHV